MKTGIDVSKHNGLTSYRICATIVDLDHLEKYAS